MTLRPIEKAAFSVISRVYWFLGPLPVYWNKEYSELKSVTKILALPFGYSLQTLTALIYIFVGAWAALYFNKLNLPLKLELIDSFVLIFQIFGIVMIWLIIHLTSRFVAGFNGILMLKKELLQGSRLFIWHFIAMANLI